MRHNRWLIIATGILTFVWFAADAHADVVIKVRALNPLDTTETAPIQYPLPKEITEKDILKRVITYSLDHSEHEEPPKTEFNIEFDEEQGGYFIKDEVVLLPKEVVTLAVHVNDIWVIPTQQIEEMRGEVDGLLNDWEEQLKQGSETKTEEEKSKDEETKEFALMMKGEVLKGLDEIMARQEKNSIIAVGVERHITAYSDNIGDLRQIQQDIVLLANLIQYEGDLEAAPPLLPEELPKGEEPASDDVMDESGIGQEGQEPADQLEDMEGAALTF